MILLVGKDWITVTNIFSSDKVCDKLRYQSSDSEILINIEDSKIIKSAHDLKKLKKVNNKKKWGSDLINQLWVLFVTLPWREADVNLKWIRSVHVIQEVILKEILGLLISRLITVLRPYGSYSSNVLRDTK